MLRKRLVLHCMQVSSFTGMRKTTHIINADMCQFLASLNESRESYESYFTPKEMFDIWKKQKVSDYSPFPVTRKTYQELEDEGILVTEPKKGFFVSDQNVHSILSLRQKEEFRKAVIRCQETGISEDDAQKIVREVYEGKQG